MKRTLTFFIAAMAMISVLVSCKHSGPEDVTALVTKDGDPAGLIITYGSIIDKSSVNTATYSVKGYEVAQVFASKNNPFLEEKPEGDVSFVVLLLKAGEKVSETPKVEVQTIQTTPNISVRQVKGIKTVKGKTVPSWDDSYKATNAFLINGGLIK